MGTSGRERRKGRVYEHHEKDAKEKEMKRASRLKGNETIFNNHHEDERKITPKKYTHRN